MKQTHFSDVTLKHAPARMTFREKVNTAKMMNKLQISAIELPVIENVQIDSLLVKSIAATITNSIVTLPVVLTEEGVDVAWAALKSAERPRLQVAVPVSPVQMEYVCHKKAPKVLEMIDTLLKKCCSLCADVEFVAEDATRAEKDFLEQVFKTAVDAGVSMISVYDNAGLMLPAEFGAFTSEVREMIPENVTFAVGTSRELGMADICAVEAVRAGAEVVKVCACGDACSDIQSLTHLMTARGDICGATPVVKTTELTRTVDAIRSMNLTEKSKHSPFDDGVREDAHASVGELGESDDLAAVKTAVKKLGYDLSDEDYANVYEAVKKVTRKKNVNAKELDAIIASTALQVPPAYKLESYVINAGNVISATAAIEMTYEGEKISGVSMGDGPIDAAFLAIEQIIGCHYELDDFQIRSITEGREAVGDALIRLRANGKLYSGRGISTDIIGASISGYISALNKIVYEQQ